MTKKCVILISGGLDSTTVLAIAKKEGYKIYGLSFDYGQRHRWELESSQKVGAFFQVKKHITLKIDLTAFGGSALTDQALPVSMGNKVKEEEDIIPLTYVPARNTVFLSLGLAWAEVLEAYHIFIGVNALDYSGYPDCRREFIQAYENMANLATKAGVEGKKFRILTPLINLTKKEIIEKGIELGVDYSLTHSCYNPDEKGISCGKCASCQLRIKGFKEIGIKDPIIYQ